VQLGRIRQIHFIGIGGSGMSGIAEVLLNLGYRVSGSDVQRSEVTDRLAGLGARVEIGHAPENVADAEVVVVSSAVQETNPEVVRARDQRVPVIPRAEMLGELMRMKHAVAVAGSHGKTSTTSMLATLLVECGLDPTVVIGGRLGVFGSNAKLGSGRLMVAEADESDGSFLKLPPTIAVVTGIDREHLDHYGGYDDLLEAFVGFVSRVPFYGRVVACVDDPGVRRILPRVERPIVTYGTGEEAELRAVDVEISGFTSRFTVQRRDHPEVAVRLSTPGRHQVLNALAALAVADELRLSPRVAAVALEDFPGADRRMQRHGESSGVLVVDDYGHHPREIAATLAAAREAVGERRMVVLFQPHRHSRTALLLEDFGPVFAEADLVLVTDIYAAGETPREGVDTEALVRVVAEAGHPAVEYAGPLETAIEELLGRVSRGDVVLTLGAGSVAGAPRRILAGLGGGP
jgi:UDP-N-acetylmuramate--alanine ligase